MTIVRLPEEVINQIAAGEVVENPASIVKELVENSLDAGAKRIDVIFAEEWVQIEDDGEGMSREDAVCSLERHATSKIRLTEDLLSLQTMGFRGEALAAIASVSQLEMKTSTGEVGTRIVVEGGTVMSVEPHARNRGTTISVRSLFYNTPARKKFQKSKKANATQVLKTLETTSLAHPDVAFSLLSSGKRVLQLSSQKKRERIEAVLGPFKEEVTGHGIWGLLGAPEEAKGQRRGQYVFVNRRPVFSPFVARAVQLGYGTRLAEGLYPPFVLFLELDPQEVDANVHPQKREVRFREEGKLFRRIEEAVAASFGVMPLSSPFFSEPVSFPFSFAEAPKPSFPQPLPLLFSEKPLRVLGPYLFLEAEELLLVDLRKAQARILFEALTEKRRAAQTLLWPLEIEDGDESLCERLQEIGVACHPIGKRRVAIDALPSQIDVADFPEFLTTWKEGKRLDQVSSRFSHARKRIYTTDEGVLLWKQLKTCRETKVDPLGAPIWKKIEAADLERWLK